MLRDVKIADIKIGKRYRKDMGDLTSLADSISHDGLLQPIGVTDKFRLVFGELTSPDGFWYDQADQDQKKTANDS